MRLLVFIIAFTYLLVNQAALVPWVFWTLFVLAIIGLVAGVTNITVQD